MPGVAGVDNAGYLCHLHRFEYWLVQTTVSIPYIYCGSYNPSRNVK